MARETGRNGGESLTATSRISGSGWPRGDRWEYNALSGNRAGIRARTRRAAPLPRRAGEGTAIPEIPGTNEGLVRARRKAVVAETRKKPAR